MLSRPFPCHPLIWDVIFFEAIDLYWATGILSSLIGVVYLRAPRFGNWCPPIVLCTTLCPLNLKLLQFKRIFLLCTRLWRFMYIKPCQHGNISDIGLPELDRGVLFSGPLADKGNLSSWVLIMSWLSINGL